MAAIRKFSLIIDHRKKEKNTVLHLEITQIPTGNHVPFTNVKNKKQGEKNSSLKEHLYRTLNKIVKGCIGSSQNFYVEDPASSFLEMTTHREESLKGQLK